jgi:LmbE family N-acetylglucosaminyl deacetylase
MLPGNKIIVLAPHTDDGELGCGASIVRWLREGYEVYYVAFSAAEESVPEGYPKDQLRTEVREATAALGLKQDHVMIFNHVVRKLNYVRQEILEDLIALREKIKPDVVLIPCSQDVHQDHQTIHQEAIRAFRHCSIFGYELIWNNLSFHTDLFIELSESDLQKKVMALKAYKTQSNRPYMQADFIRSLAVVRGVQVGKKYAESFEVIRWILPAE